MTGLPGLELAARLAGTPALARGDRRGFSVPAEALYLFDGDGRSVAIRQAPVLIAAFSEAV